MSDGNPWLRVRAADYEGHMADPGVGQLGWLAAHFAAQVQASGARRIALLGCATGNGLEGLDPACIERVLAVDINPEYLAIVRARHVERLGARLVLRCADLDDPAAAKLALAPGGYELIHTALLFEYLEPARLLPVLARALAPGGLLAAVLQLPSPTLPAVTPTAFVSIHELEPFLRLRAPAELSAPAAALGLEACERGQAVLPSGKRFELLAWRRPIEP